MTALYLFFAAVGVPLVIWTLVAGGDEGEAGDPEGAGEGGPLMLRLVPLSSLAIAAAGFGVTGLVFELLDAAEATVLVLSVLVAVLAGVLNSALFAYVRRTGSTSDVSDAAFAGAIGRVVVPIEPAHRGRVVVTLGERELALTAEVMPDTPALDLGDAVVVVEIEHGVARVAPLELP